MSRNRPDLTLPDQTDFAATSVVQQARTAKNRHLVRMAKCKSVDLGLRPRAPSQAHVPRPHAVCEEHAEFAAADDLSAAGPGDPRKSFTFGVAGTAPRASVESPELLLSNSADEFDGFGHVKTLE
jgi:hypothetical protein